jgi:hypothetical protein
VADPQPEEQPWYGVADGTVFAAEVRNITDDNEEEQLRLGLGQVLRCRHRLERLGHERVAAVLIPERSSRDASWADLCRELQVALISGKELERAPVLGREAGLSGGSVGLT